MAMYRKILVPLDGSDSAAQGLSHAIALGRACGSPLCLLHVIDAFPMSVEWTDTGSWRTLIDTWRTEGRALLDAAAAQAREQGVVAETMLLEFPAGRVADSIVDQAVQHGCDLIVMGSHGRRGLGRMLLGSDAEMVLRTAHMPVLVVRPPPAPAG